jgi:hypothetical protein
MLSENKNNDNDPPIFDWRSFENKNNDPPMFNWRCIDTDDYLCHWNGLLLRVEQMDTYDWWWAVFKPDHKQEQDKGWEEYGLHDGEAAETGFPRAKTWQDACYFAELYAAHLHQYGKATLSYLTHSETKESRLLRLQQKRESPPFADFPDHIPPVPLVAND